MNIIVLSFQVAVMCCLIISFLVLVFFVISISISGYEEIKEFFSRRRARREYDKYNTEYYDRLCKKLGWENVCVDDECKWVDNFFYHTHNPNFRNSRESEPVQIAHNQNCEGSFVFKAQYSLSGIEVMSVRECSTCKFTDNQRFDAIRDHNL